ncbi:hypothetical protein JL09_g6631 [Pichia kudriavzevii]|uniref:Uncharacterized protein n=1 Tax=Pichia kudriavzevii TaxID=4909 RepID=A0A099NJ11_PICKU|nr:hypothetical protein JL09_g6695 [Pichia kudriavzevii]KGK32777.1 hypothetical protein JL09_g6631 [Pichia kudriavzevii]
MATVHANESGVVTGAMETVIAPAFEPAFELVLELELAL